jgi:DNA-binding transcriptional ArsR family regulator
MSPDKQTETLLVLHNIEDKLQEILKILRMTSKENIEAAQDRVLAGSPLRRRIFELCDGHLSVSAIAEALEKSVQQISNNITVLQDVGLLKEIRSGREKRYQRMR